MEAVGSRPEGAGEAIAPVVDGAGMIPATGADAAQTPTPTVGAHTHTPQEPSEVNVGVGVTESPQPAGAAVLPHDPHDDGSASSSSSDDSDSDDSDNDEAEGGAAAMDARDAVIDQTVSCLVQVQVSVPWTIPCRTCTRHALSPQQVLIRSPPAPPQPYPNPGIVNNHRAPGRSAACARWLHGTDVLGVQGEPAGVSTLCAPPLTPSPQCVPLLPDTLPCEVFPQPAPRHM